MGLMDGLGDKAKKLAEESGESIEQGVEKVGDFIDEKTHGKSEKITDKVQDAVASGLDHLRKDKDGDPAA